MQQVMELAQDGTLMPGDMVRKKTGEWVVANTIRGLFPVTATADEADAADASDADASEAGSDDGTVA